jgi:hypothetical protein
MIQVELGDIAPPRAGGLAEGQGASAGAEGWGKSPDCNRAELWRESLSQRRER